MRVHVLKTDGGTHSEWSWATATAGLIFDIDDVQGADRMAEARDMLASIATTLAGYFRDHVLLPERDKLASNPDRLNDPFDAHMIAREAVAKIQDSARNSKWGNSLQSQEWEDVAINMISNNMNTAQHVERLWYADSNKNNTAAQAYKAKWHQE